jgi:hypothetical protein
MTGEFKKLGEILEADPALKSRVVVGKVGHETAVQAGDISCMGLIACCQLCAMSWHMPGRFV